jgi:alpha-methylacyl-CoA racemase
MSGSLAGVRIVELGGIGPAPFATMLLADHGADVIRIDRPVDACGPGDVVLGRGKRSIVLDLKAPADLEIALKLVDRADVVIDPMRPGAAERLGLGADACRARNPRLIYAQMTGWGQSGPLAATAGHDLNYIAVAGALHAIGSSDQPPPVPLNLIGDYGGGGMFLAFGITSALYERERSGVGQILDVAMVDGVASLMAVFAQLRASGQWTAQRQRHWLDGGTPWYRAYRTRDEQFVTVAALEPQFYAEILSRLGLDPHEWPQWDQAMWPALAALFEARFAEQTLTQWQSELEATDACFGAVLDLEAAACHPQLASRETYVSHDGVPQPAPAPRFSRTPGSIRGRGFPPGTHSDEIRAELG